MLTVIACKAVTAQQAAHSVAGLMEDGNWRALHAVYIEAIEGALIYFKSLPVSDFKQGEPYDVYKVTVSVYNSSGEPVKWQVAKVGRAVIRHKTKGGLWAGNYTGSPFGKQLLDYRIVNP